MNAFRGVDIEFRWERERNRKTERNGKCEKNDRTERIEREKRNMYQKLCTELDYHNIISFCLQYNSPSLFIGSYPTAMN